MMDPPVKRRVFSLAGNFKATVRLSAGTAAGDALDPVIGDAKPC